MALLDKDIHAFDRAVEDWPTYVERLQQYLEVNKILPEKHVAALWSMAGKKSCAQFDGSEEACKQVFLRNSTNSIYHQNS